VASAVETGNLKGESGRPNFGVGWKPQLSPSLAWVLHQRVRTNSNGKRLCAVAPGKSWQKLTFVKDFAKS